MNATILGQTISFILFVWFCMKYVWSPFMLIIEKRQKDIADSLADAKRVQLESERIKVESEAFLENARIKAQKIILQANEFKEQMLYDAKCTANKERDRILSQAKEQVFYERKRMLDVLRSTVGQLVIESAEKIIEHSIDQKIDQKLIDNIVDTLLHED